MKGIRITLLREEALAAAIALSNEKKPYKWQQQALAKVDKALGLAKRTDAGLRRRQILR